MSLRELLRDYPRHLEDNCDPGNDWTPCAACCHRHQQPDAHPCRHCRYNADAPTHLARDRQPAHYQGA